MEILIIILLGIGTILSGVFALIWANDDKDLTGAIMLLTLSWICLGILSYTALHKYDYEAHCRDYISGKIEMIIQEQKDSQDNILKQIHYLNINSNYIFF